MLFDFDIKCLRFDVNERRIIDARDSLGRNKVMQVASELCELCARCLFLPFLLFYLESLLVILELFAHLLILMSDMVEIGLAGVEIVLVFPRVVPSVTNSNGYGENNYYF